MKQVIQDVRTGEITVLDVPAPQAGPGLALVRTAASLLSPGTERTLVEFAGRSLLGKARARPDLARRTIEKAAQEGVLATLEAVQSRLDRPVAVGYSSAGVIEELGPELAGLRVGQRVVCAGGGYAVHAELAAMPRNLMAPLPDGVSLESGCFATLAAVVLHGIRLAEVQVGHRVAVIGLGLLGQLAMRIVRAAGGRPWGVDLVESRVERARTAGCSASLRADADEAGPAFTAGVGFDSILICASTSSSDPVDLAGELARERARIVAVGDVGLQIPRRVYYAKELDLIVSRAYGPGRYDPEYEERGADYPIGYVRWTIARNLEAIGELLASGKLAVDDLVTHRFPVSQAPDAYQLLQDPVEDTLAIVLEYPDGTRPRRDPVRFKPASLDKTKRVRLGVIGAGNFATSTALPALSRIPEIELAAIVSGSGLSSADAGRRFGFEYAASDPRGVYQDASIDTVAILTRHNLHARQIVEAIQAGKHVFCEKPPALSTRELGEIASALRQFPSQVFTVGYNRRFAPLTTLLMEFVASAKTPCSIIYRVNAGPLPAGHWLLDEEQGGGRLIGECGHFIDLMGAIVGSPAERVLASQGAGSPGDPSYAIQIDYADGSNGSLMYATGGDRRLSKERIEYFGGGRAAVLDDFRRLELVQGGRVRAHRRWLRQDKGHRAIWSRFVAAIRAGEEPIPYSSLFMTSAVTFAAQRAIERGQPVEPQEFLPD